MRSLYHMDHMSVATREHLPCRRLNEVESRIQPVVTGHTLSITTPVLA